MLSNDLAAQRVGIGTSNPVSSAILELRDTSRGFLPPRVTLSQRNSIQNPAIGLIIWCVDCDELQVYNGTIWKSMCGTAASGSSLPNVKICNQLWMVKNLSVTTYRNGDIIPQVTDPSVWSNITIGAWCWYNNDSATYHSYGRLYNWYAVNDPRGLAPVGWHVPTDAELTTLETCLGGSLVAGGKMKVTGMTTWLSPNAGADNSSGWSALPGGSRGNSGSFAVVESFGYWWSSTENNVQLAFGRFLSYNNSTVLGGGISKAAGLSVRCLKD